MGIFVTRNTVSELMGRSRSCAWIITHAVTNQTAASLAVRALKAPMGQRVLDESGSESILHREEHKAYAYTRLNQRLSAHDTVSMGLPPILLMYLSCSCIHFVHVPTRPSPVPTLLIVIPASLTSSPCPCIWTLLL